MKLLVTLLMLVAAAAAKNQQPSLSEWDTLSNTFYTRMADLQQRLANKEYHASPKHDDPVPLMIAKEGYPCETHTVITDDCYILELHRIPYGKNSPLVPGETKPVIHLQHGLLASSADWVMGIPEKFLGYILADAGFDVWLGNFRGNTYSRNHCELNPNRNDFWYFSWGQNGRFDLPAMINYESQITGYDRIHYVGHSMGTTSVLAMMHERPEMGDKIIMANFLAPVAFMEHMTSPIKFLAPFLDDIEWIAVHLGLGEFLPSNFFTDALADIFCDDGWLQPLCESVLFLLCGFDPAQVNETLLDTIIHHTPAGASTFQLLHYSQEYKSGNFEHYDMGPELNMEYYGQADVPPYDLSRVTIPISLYWSQNDWLANPSDVLSLLSRLPNIYSNYEVPYENWNHLDYLFGIDADVLVYEELLATIAQAQADEDAGLLGKST